MQSTSSIKRILAEPENRSLVIGLLKADPPPSRNALAKELCRSLDLRDSKGKWQMTTTSKALRELEAQGLWLLPKPLFSGPGQWNPIRLNQPVPLPTDVPEWVQDLRGLRLLLVEDQEHQRIWNALMLSEHPLKDCRLVGRQLCYLIGSDHGWLGGLGFGSAALHSQGRENWVGWNHCQRGEHLERVINMNRFLIRPLVKDLEDLQRRVGVKPPVVSALSPESGLDGAGWAEHEFGDCELGDERLTRRLVKIVSDQAAQPSGSYSQAAGGNRHDLKGYYRFLNNPNPDLDVDTLLEGHRARTIRRMSQESTALIVQDSSDSKALRKPRRSPRSFPTPESLISQIGRGTCLSSLTFAARRRAERPNSWFAPRMIALWKKRTRSFSPN